MKFNKLVYQILVIFTIVVVVCLGASGWFLLWVSEGIVTRNISEGYELLTQRIAQEVEAEIISIEPVLTLLAESRGVRQMEPYNIKSEIDRVQESFPEITSIYVAGVDGMQIARTGTDELENVSNVWGFQVARGGEELVSDIYPEPLTSEPMRSIFIPITQYGLVIGVVSADVSFGRVMDSILDVDVGENGTVAVVANNGRVVAHTFMGQLPELDLSKLPVIEAVLAGQEGAMQGYTDGLGRQVLGVYSPIPELGWGVVIQKPLSDIDAEISQLKTTGGLATAGAVLLTVLAGWLMSRQSTRPIRKLAVASERIAQCDLSTAVDVRSSNEIGVLASSFNQMMESLKTSRDELEKRIVDLQRAENDLRRYTEQLEAVRKASLYLTSSLTLKPLLEEILKQILNLASADYTHIFLYDGKQLTFGAAYWAEESKPEPLSEPRQDGLTYRVAREGEVIVIPDIKQHPLYQNYDFPWEGSIVGLPLRSGDSVIGVINISYEDPHVFIENELHILELLSDQAAVAIENAHLHEQMQNHADQLEEEVKLATKEIQKRADELATLYDVGKEITSTLDLEPMLQIIADDVVNLVEANKSLILLIDAEREKLKNAVGHGYSREHLIGLTFEEFQDGLSGWVFNKKEPTMSADIQTDERNRGKALASAKRSGSGPVAVAPLLIENEVIGTLTVINKRQKRAFTQSDLNLVIMLAGQAAIAIQNAQLYEAAQEADRLKSAFLASMSHELRTPLNSIIGFTGMILDGLVGPLSDEQAKQLGMVFESAEHLLNLINDVLDISKIEAGQLETSSEPFNIQAVIEKVVRSISPLAERKALTVVTEIAPEIGQITSDQRRIEQIIINLVNNAIKFTEQGTVSIECLVDNGWLITRVADTGIGINSEDMDMLFKAFRQIDTGIARRYEGTGLGLSICKKLVEILGGDIWVESERGVGSTFSLVLPLLKE